MDCKITSFLSLVLLIAFGETLSGQSARERSVEVSTTITETPARFDFNWPVDASASGYQVYRKELDAMDWGDAVASLPGDATSYFDEGIETGIGYEYAFFKKDFDLIRDTFCLESGLELRFTISDMYDIGLCCNFGFGYYQVEACGEVKAYGDDFGGEEITEFVLCNDSDSCEQVIVTINPDMFPNSTSWVLEDSANDELLASSGDVGDFIAERPKYGFIYSGIQLPAQEDRGEILLLVDSSYLLPLETELLTLQMDFIRDGWLVSMQGISINEPVTEVRSKIQTVYNLSTGGGQGGNSSTLKAVYLLGHIPVPYSGNIYPDTHSENHQGAWSADSYYGEMNGNWTDEVADITTAFFERNHNVPGDGKFDQDSIPTKLELQVGRVDLSNLSDFTLSEIELTRQYLNKAHQFKLGSIEVNRRALIDDNFGQAFAAPAASGWRNFAPMFGHESVAELDYFETMSEESYLWSYGCGSGSHVSASGIGTTEDFAADSLLSVFTMLFGSQFGDWDNSNNFLRAPLAQGLTLTNVWAGSPPWTFHHMAMGYPIGYSTMRTLNSTNGVYQNGPQLVHANLMGDPTLRMHPVKTITDLETLGDGGVVNLSWEAPVGETNIEGYYVYKSESINGPWSRITADFISNNTFTDENPIQGNNNYMVRTVKLETSGSGSYFNLALGVVDSLEFVSAATALLEEPLFSVFPNPTSDVLHVNFGKLNTDQSTLTILNSSGKVVFVKAIRHANNSSTKVDLSNFANGVYFVKIKQGLIEQTKKVIIAKTNRL
ncbi:MAG: T9SS type A sorting domain-containing protein [Saprospiraceae bacterium]